MNEPILCACGCEEIVSPGARFIHGHNRKGIKQSEAHIRERTVARWGKCSGPKIQEMIPCACGCRKLRLKYDSKGRERRYIHGHAKKRDNPLIECACGCGATFPEYDHNGYSRQYISGHAGIETRFQKGHKIQIGEKHWNWKDGRHIDEMGYVKIRVGPGQYRREHRIVMEKKLGKPLKPTELIHHINENRADNQKENLKLMTRREHNEEHGKRRKEKSLKN